MRSVRSADQLLERTMDADNARGTLLLLLDRPRSDVDGTGRTGLVVRPVAHAVPMDEVAPR